MCTDLRTIHQLLVLPWVHFRPICVDFSVLRNYQSNRVKTACAVNSFTRHSPAQLYVSMHVYNTMWPTTYFWVICSGFIMFFDTNENSNLRPDSGSYNNPSTKKNTNTHVTPLRNIQGFPPLQTPARGRARLPARCQLCGGEAYIAGPTKPQH